MFKVTEKLTKPQKVFRQTVENWIDHKLDEQRSTNRQLKKQYPDLDLDVNPDLDREFWENKLLYNLQDNGNVMVDSMLYQVLKMGYGEYGLGKGLLGEIIENLKDAGYYMENYGMGEWRFFEC